MLKPISINLKTMIMNSNDLPAYVSLIAYDDLIYDVLHNHDIDLYEDVDGNVVMSRCDLVKAIYALTTYHFSLDEYRVIFMPSDYVFKTSKD